MPVSNASFASQSTVGIYFPPATIESTHDCKPGSGIWPGVNYQVTQEIFKNNLTAVTQKHFPNVGYANNAGDSRFTYVIEYIPRKPEIDKKSFRSLVPMEFTIREPKTGRPLESIRLTGEGSPKGNHYLRLFFGPMIEKGALERSLNEAYSDLLIAVDANLARFIARESGSSNVRPYLRR